MRTFKIHFEPECKECEGVGHQLNGETCSTCDGYGVLEEKEHSVEVEFDYSPGRPGRMYMPNGDPGYPEEPEELVINKIAIEGEDVTTTISPILKELIETKVYETITAKPEYDPD
jgi:DnaJ-class molecular chaperone